MIIHDSSFFMIIHDSFGYGPKLTKENYAKVMPLIQAIEKTITYLFTQVIIKRGGCLFILQPGCTTILS
jgi:hypothetical protein